MLAPCSTTIKGALVEGISKRLQHSYFGVNCASKLTGQFKEVRHDPLVSVPRALVLRRYVHGALGAYITSLEITCCYIVIALV